jgi:uncharacterized OB-fold protein
MGPEPTPTVDDPAYWPVPDRFSAPFWEYAARHRLAFQRCSSCGRFQHPPGPICRHCYDRDLAFDEVAGNGTVYSFTVTYYDFARRADLSTPYVVALVELDDADGVRMLANVVECSPEDVHVGMKLSVVFDDIKARLSLPQFRPEEAAGD